jgi:DNA-binding transcriptional MocR family regulator
MAEEHTREDFLYSQIADRFAVQIEKGILKAGDKLISLRALSKEQGISLSTAFKAYVELENKGIIEARPKSGYFVRFSPLNAPERLHSASPGPLIEKANVEEMIRTVYKTMTHERIIRLSVAAPSAELIPEAKLTKAMIEALRKSPHSCTQYEEVQGNPALRKQIAKYAFNWKGNVSEDDVVTTQGCMEALIFCLKAVTEPGDTVAIENPIYFGIFNIMKSLGLKILEIPCHPDEGADLEYLEKALETIPVKAVLFVPNFSNPTGALMPITEEKIGRNACCAADSAYRR